MTTRNVPRIIAFEFISDYTLELVFKDGTRRIVDLQPYLQGPIFEPLLDSSLFAQVFIEEGGGLAWPSGADLCPNMLYYDLPPASVGV